MWLLWQIWSMFWIYLEIWWGLVVDSWFETRPNKFGTSRKFTKRTWPPKLAAWQVPQRLECLLARGWGQCGRGLSRSGSEVASKLRRRVFSKTGATSFARFFLAGWFFGENVFKQTTEARCDHVCLFYLTLLRFLGFCVQQPDDEAVTA